MLSSVEISSIFFSKLMICVGELANLIFLMKLVFYFELFAMSWEVSVCPFGNEDSILLF